MRHLSEYQALSDMGNGMEQNRPLYIVSIEEKVNLTGKKQVILTVRDGVSTEKVSVFDTDVECLQKAYPFLTPGAVAEMTISKKDPFYNARKDEVRDLSDEEPFDLTEIAEKATESDPMSHYNYILRKVREVAKDDGVHTPISHLAEAIYEKMKDELIYSSSAIGMHHTGIHGNIVHTAEVMNICDVLTKTVLGRDIDKELLFTAAALHDVGKLECYHTDSVGVATMTLKGYALGGHHYSSLLAIEEEEKLGNYDQERILILKNLIASHHGNKEYGDLATPLTLEGYWLHAADDLDAKHYEVRKAIMELQPGGVSAKNKMLETYLYRRTDQ